MKFCYCDETGTDGTSPHALMCGIIVDSHRMHKTKQHWADLLDRLSDLANHRIEELHTREFYPGNGVWRKGLRGDKRAEIIDTILDWLIDRSHKAVLVCVNVKAYERSKQTKSVVYPELERLSNSFSVKVKLGDVIG